MPLDETQDFLKDFENKFVNFEIEKKEISQKLEKVMTENETLKTRFKELMDKFQNYVNEIE